ncbi:hypothetical protein CFD26_101750 [Aspergillus turcosus]|uniref:Uncharacterized protein n=1 Tax=Aspergillus turcosus TaxID=1245748 RepID=A0A3R7JBJ5_9EURO|nr:hypothetical protein CFD26_101750 [Aspergillus turcosus]
MSSSASSRVESCIQQLTQLISSGRLTAYENEVPLDLWQLELNRLQMWAGTVPWESLNFKSYLGSVLEGQIHRCLRTVERTFTNIQDVLDNNTADEDMSDSGTDDDDADDGRTEMQMIHYFLRDAINCLDRSTAWTRLGPSRGALSGETPSTTRTMVENEPATMAGNEAATEQKEDAPERP